MDGESGARPAMILFGDSIAAGLGVREARYSDLVARGLGLQLIDRSQTGATATETLARFREDPVSGQVALIAHGITEAIYRPSPRYLRFMPRRWRRRGWMDPRPYYSRRWNRRLLERTESAVRWRLKVLIMRLPHGRYQLVPVTQYVAAVSELVALLRDRGCSALIVAPPPIDSRFFPGSDIAQRRYRDALEDAGIPIIEIDDALQRWDDFFLDHFHPNVSGHAKIAAVVAPRIRALIEAPTHEEAVD